MNQDLLDHPMFIDETHDLHQSTTMFIAAMAHLRTVDNRTGLFDITQLGQRKGIADDVLGNILDALGVTSLKPHFVVDTAPNNSHGISSDTKLKFLLH
jgi:hypothetical protein